VSVANTSEAPPSLSSGHRELRGIPFSLVPSTRGRYCEHFAKLMLILRRAPVFPFRGGWQLREDHDLPSFGTFTGGATIRPAPTDALFVAGPERVIALGLSQGRSRSERAE